MNAAITGARPGFGFADRYLAVNETFRQPFSIALSDRGHYSEVNCLLTGMTYGLIHRHRLIVDEAGFDDLSWRDLYASELPTGTPDISACIDPEWSMLSNVPGKRRFGSMLRRVQRHSKRHLPVWNWALGMGGGVFPIMRQMADAFCQPSFPMVLPTLPGSYAAFHIRRGDKVLGSMFNGQRTIPEGEITPMSAYIDVLRLRAPDTRFVWVMTDDYRTVQELRALAPHLTFETLCSPGESGYEQTEFSARSPADKTAGRQRLIMETEVAIRSSIFVGGFLSNVDRFIVLRHRDPKACFSVDRQKAWFPG